jgi:outer membrane murein-binding lipoprotein Lpp
MTDAGESTPPSANNVAALVEAIDARARVAGSEGAATLLRGMIGSVSEALGEVQDRIERVEDLLTDRPAPEAALIDQISTSLQSFHSRLGRLEEAFVQAVEDSGSGTDAVVEQVRGIVASALRDAPPPPAALAVPDEQARASLYRIETALTRFAADRLPDPIPVLDAAVDRLGARLDALEQLARALADAPPPAAPDPPDLSTPLEEALAPLRAKLTGLEQLIRARGDDRPDQTGAFRAALAPIAERLDGLELAARGADGASDERSRRLDAVPTRLSGLDEKMKQLVEKVSEPQPSLDLEVLARLEEAVDALARGESAARLVQLVEERLGAAVRAMSDRADSTRRAIDELEESRAADRHRMDDLASAVRALAGTIARLPEQTGEVAGQQMAGRLSTLGDRLEGLDARLDGADARLAGIDDNVAAVHEKLGPLGQLDRLDRLDRLAAAPFDVSQVVDAITGSVRREAELLTQRVAALAVGVEAARVMLEQHVEETENSIGRRAGEMTRRLAADFGIRKPRTSPRRDPRELGPGAAS